MLLKYTETGYSVGRFLHWNVNMSLHYANESIIPKNGGTDRSYKISLRHGHIKVNLNQ